MTLDIQQDPTRPPLPSQPLEGKEQKRGHRKKILLLGGGVLAMMLALVTARVSFTFQRVSHEGGVVVEPYGEEPNFIPYHDPERVNVLVLGLRGADDPEGGLLTDEMMVASIQKTTHRAAFVSIPRDLWVRMPGKRTYDKINAAYALGFEEGGSEAALAYATAVAEKVTGLKMDGAVSVNIAAVREFIDMLGGVTITLGEPFVEDRQWVRGGDMGTSTAFVIRTDTVSTTNGLVQLQKWVFQLPKGTVTLDGTTALYYLRARYASNDFERARRQQKVLVAAAAKTKSLGIFLNPFKINDLLRTFERNVVTDMPLSRIVGLSSYASHVQPKDINHIVLEIGGHGLLAVENREGIYTLVPKTGNFEEIRRVCREVFTEAGK